MSKCIYCNNKSITKKYKKYCSLKCLQKDTPKENITREFISTYLLTKDGTLTRGATMFDSAENLYKVFYNLNEAPLCECLSPRQFWNFTKGYRETCGDMCEYTKKRKIENMVKHRPPEINKKISESLKHRSKAEIDDATRKGKQTRLKRYGSENYVNIKQRVKTLNSKREAKEPISGSKILHIEHITKEYITEHFIDKNGSLLREEMMKYFGASKTFVYSTLKRLNIKYKKNKNYTEYSISKLIDDAIMNSRKIIPPLEIDIYSEKYQFGIEYNGLMWHSYGYSKYDIFDYTKNTRGFIEEPKRHLNKTELAEEKEIQLFHIFENEWLESPEIWTSILNSKMNKTKRIFARKCIVKEISTKEAKEFMDTTHLQGYVNSKIKLGLFYENELVSVMTFGKNRYSKLAEYELLRFASKLNTTIVGGASRLLKYFERNYNPKSIVSYANRRFSTGNLYKQLGFGLHHKTAPNYFYFKENEFILHSRVKFQKHKLKNILEEFNPELSESENMFLNGYRRIYDSGNLVFVKHFS